MNENNYINELIEKAVEKFGRINLSNGNCGQFSLALAQQLIDKGFKPKIGVLHKYDEEVTDLDELASQEVPVYHVVLILNDKIFDSTGEITTYDLVQFSKREYRDSAPSYIKDIGVNEISLHSIIESETNWYIPKEMFYNFFKSLEIKNKQKIKP